MRHFLCIVLLLGSYLASVCEAEVKVAVEPILKNLGVTLKVQQRPKWPSAPGGSVQVTLAPQDGQAGRQVVSFGLPFPPATLRDEKLLRVLGPDGREVPAFTRPLVRWWIDGKQGALRSVLVQFELSFQKGTSQQVTVDWDKPRTKSRAAEVPIAETQFVRHVDPPKGYEKRAFSYDYRCPKVLALLPPKWLCASLVAWQQVPAEANEIAPWFDKHLLDKVDYSFRNISAKAFEGYLFDRPATYSKIYIRHGGEKFLLAALKANDFYTQHVGEDGFFDIKKSKDYKYSFNEGSAILYMLTGDPRYLDAVKRIVKCWMGWTYNKYGKLSTEYTPQTRFWTERHHGFGMAAYVHAYEITGEKKWLEIMTHYFNGTFAMQTTPGDGKAPDGAWCHRASNHGDGNGWTTSPWMSAFLADSVWKYWLITGDQRAAASLAMYAKFTAKNSIWPDGDMVYYMANSPGRGRSEGGGVEHNFEGIYLLALGYYFSGGTDLAYLKTISTLAPPVMDDGANNPARKFNWRFRETSKLLWLLYNALPTREASLKQVRSVVRPVLPEGPEKYRPKPGDVGEALKGLGVELKVVKRRPFPAPPADSVVLSLTSMGEAAVATVGVPFGPGWLGDDQKIRVLDAAGKELPAFTRPLAHWWIDGKKGTPRSVLVQFPVAVGAARVTLRWDMRRTQQMRGPAAASQTHETAKFGVQAAFATKAEPFECAMPKVVVTLPAEWLCASLVAGRQLPAAKNKTAPWYDKHLLANFDKSLPWLSAIGKNWGAHLADRTAGYVKVYVRHGRPEKLLSALHAGEHYIRHLGANGLHDIRPRPARTYSFVEGSALLYLLTGEQRFRDAAERATKAWAKYDPDFYSKYEFWDEREHGLGMLAAVHMYELTGEAKWLERTKQFFETALSLQTNPADGRPPDGAWVHSAKSHGEGAGWLSSPWMSGFLADAIWKYWALTGDERAAASLLMYAKFVRDHGIGSKGVYDLASSPARGDGTRPSVKHNLAGIHLLAFGTYFSGGDASFQKKIDALHPPLTRDDANNPPYGFTRRFRASSTLTWLLGQ